MKKLGLIPKLLIAIILGLLIGYFLPDIVIQIFVTFSDIFSEFLKFVIPLMIVGFIVKGISDLNNGAGKLLGITTGIAYLSTVIAGTFALLVSYSLFPSFIDNTGLSSVTQFDNNQLQPLFELKIPPFFDVTSAIVFAFVIGLCISSMRGKEIGNVTYDFFTEFSEIIKKVLNTTVIPLLPLFIIGIIANMTHSGAAFFTLSVLWKVIIVFLLLQFVYAIGLFLLSGFVSKKNPMTFIKNQIPAYITAAGTQSSGASIPINLQSAKKNGVSKQIADFVIPLCATIHMCGSVITITCCVVAMLMMFEMPYSIALLMPMILVLAVAMVASPGVPGGGVMTALPFLGIVGITPESAIASLLIALYVTQDSFGTAINVSGDSAIAIIVDTIYKKFMLKSDNPKNKI